MPAIQQDESLDPVPAWRLRVWAEMGPKHRMMAKDRRGKYTTVFHTDSKQEARDWWARVQHRQGTDWKDWVWLAYYGWQHDRYGIKRLMLFHG